jgi:ankyrin repeat protein
VDTYPFCAQNLTTPIITLCRVCNKKSAAAISEANALNLLKLMIKRGADVNARNFDGYTAMMWATMNHAHLLLQELVSSGADPTIKDLVNALNAVLTGGVCVTV